MAKRLCHCVTINSACNQFLTSIFQVQGAAQYTLCYHIATTLLS